MTAADRELALNKAFARGPSARQLRPPPRSTAEDPAAQQLIYLLYDWEIRRGVLIAMVTALKTQAAIDPAQPFPLLPYQELRRQEISGIAVSAASGDSSAITPALFFPDLWAAQAMLQDNDSAASLAAAVWVLGDTGIVVCPPPR